jgi:hypothetical protein
LLLPSTGSVWVEASLLCPLPLHFTSDFLPHRP